MDVNKFTKDGKFLMLALDHRGSFKKLINPQDPDSVSDEKIIELKKEIIDALDDQFSGLLIDEVWGLQAYQKKTKPFLLPMEKSGENVAQLEYTAGHIKDLGASGAKLLIKFNPDDQNAILQIQTAKTALEDCQDNDLPLFLEIVTYVFKPGLSIQNQTGFEGSNLVLDSVKKFQEAGVVPDVWKLEYPGSFASCQQLSLLVGDIPWILLTGGDNFDTFKTKLEDADKNGAKGFLAGRALWQETTTLQGEEKLEFLSKTLPDRFKEISNIVNI